MHFMSSANFTINAVKYSFRSLINLCSSRGQHFLKCGAQSPKAAMSRVCLELIPLHLREALWALRMPNQAKGTGVSAVAYARFSKQPVPAPSRDLSNWSCTSQLGAAEVWGGVAEAWHRAPETRGEKLACEKEQNSVNSSRITQGIMISCL